MTITRFICVGCFISLLLFLTIFSVNSLSLSIKKPLWIDEVYSLNETINRLSYSNIIKNGATGQGSPSPLDYLLTKTWISLKERLNYLNMTPHQYFRFQNIVYIWLGTLFLFFLVNSKNDLRGLIAFTVSSGFLLFSKSVLYYSTEMRPYNLWVILSFLLIFLVSNRSPKIIMWIILLAISLTTTASVYQIASILTAILVSELLLSRKTIPKLVFSPTTLVFLVAFAVNFYYISKISSSGYPVPKWETFFSFWKEYAPFILISVVLVLHFLIKKDKMNLAGNLSVFGWIAFGPFSFYQTQRHTFFFDPRQYIYYFPAVAFLVYQSVIILLTPSKSFNVFKIIIPLLFIVNTSFFVKNYWIGVRNAFHSFLQGPIISIPANFISISKLLPYQIPDKYVFVPYSRELVDQRVSQANFQIWWDYINTTYPPQKFSRNTQSQFIVSDNGNNFVVSFVNKN